MTNVQLRAATGLLTVEIANPKLYDGRLVGTPKEGFTQLLVGLARTATRDLVEKHLRVEIPRCFPKQQILAIAFLGRGYDDFALVFLVPDDITSARVSPIRQIIQDTDTRALVSYPVKALV